MNYNAALAYIEEFIDYERSPDFARQTRRYNLNRISLLLAQLGNPQEKLRVVHIAGSKGKGSTAALIASVLTRQAIRPVCLRLRISLHRERDAELMMNSSQNGTLLSILTNSDLSSTQFPLPSSDASRFLKYTPHSPFPISLTKRRISLLLKSV